MRSQSGLVVRAPRLAQWSQNAQLGGFPLEESGLVNEHS